MIDTRVIFVIEQPINIVCHGSSVEILLVTEQRYIQLRIKDVSNLGIDVLPIWEERYFLFRNRDIFGTGALRLS